MSDLSHYHCLAALEIDPTQFQSEDSKAVRFLDRNGAEQLTAHISADLAAMLPEIRRCSLTTCAALYDQTQILQPRFPIFSTLSELLQASFQDGEFQSRVLSFGAAEGKLPHPALQPDPQVPPGMLLLIPLLISGDATVILDLGQTMEHEFISSGQLSAHSVQWLQSAFGVKISHGRFMTITDLAAMLRMQLDSVGFLPLWELLECALFDRSNSIRVETGCGNVFRYQDGAVRSPFFSFDAWAQSNQVKSDALGRTYVDWLRMQRQMVVTLNAHGIEVQQQLPDQDKRIISGSYFRQRKQNPDLANAATLTEHSAGDLGTIAVTVLSAGYQYDYYPLLPSGLNRIQEQVRELLGTELVAAYPGGLLYDPDSRKLIPDTLEPI